MFLPDEKCAPRPQLDNLDKRPQLRGHEVELPAMRPFNLMRGMWNRRSPYRRNPMIEPGKGWRHMRMMRPRLPSLPLCGCVTECAAWRENLTPYELGEQHAVACRGHVYYEKRRA